MGFLFLFLFAPLLTWGQGFSETPLTSGLPSGISVPAISSPTLLCCFRIEVPAGATRLEIRAANFPASAQFAFAVRFGAQPISSPLTADYPVTVGNNPLIITSSSNPPLRAGTYFIGAVVVSTPAAPSVTVTATVTSEAPPRVAVSALSLSFTTEVGINPPSQNFAIRNSGGGTPDFTVASTATWLTITPGTGRSTGQAVATTVSVNVTGLGTGTYDGTLRITAPGISGTAVVPVRLVVNAASPPPTGSITTVSAASLRAPGAPDSIVSAFGSGLAGGVEVAGSAELPESLGDVTVTVTDSAGAERICKPPAHLGPCGPGHGGCHPHH
jgi:hypothetical protein